MPKHTSVFNSKNNLQVNGKEYTYYAILGGELGSYQSIIHLPVSIKILLENLLRHATDHDDGDSAVKTLVLGAGRASRQEISFQPARVLMQDFTGVPAMVDMAAMRDALLRRGLDPQKINPLARVDLVIDHSISIEKFASQTALAENTAIEMERNHERYQFLKWGQSAFHNFSVIPPGTGICHQVNLEYLAEIVLTRDVEGECVIFPDSLVGTDSHTTMINGLGVLGWGVGGIEAEAAMLGQPISMLIPDVVGFQLTGQIPDGCTATDLVLTIVEMLRKYGVVGKFVEFYGSGLMHLPVAERATIANMAPEYGATCGFFPVDQQTLDYLRLSGRDEETISLVEAYCRAQHMWHDEGCHPPDFAETLHLDMATIELSAAGPRRPQDRVPVAGLKKQTNAFIEEQGKGNQLDYPFPLSGSGQPMHHGDVVIAALTSCTNTSNPAVMLGAGLLAKKALALGLKRKPWVKSSLAPGSRVVSDYLHKTGLQKPLDGLGFHLVGYGCTTCIGNSGPLPRPVEETIRNNDLLVCSVLSGNRNFEGRIHPLVKANWLVSPPLVVAYALAGTTRIDLTCDPIGIGSTGQGVYLQDIWPSDAEIRELMQSITREMFTKQYSTVFRGDSAWQAIECSDAAAYPFSPDSTYIQRPPFFETKYSLHQGNIIAAPVLVMLGDSVTTDHISPAGAISKDSPAAHFLRQQGVCAEDFNSYGSRRGNHEVMLRGTFANIRIHNEMTPGLEGGYTRLSGNDTSLFIYDAAMHYQSRGIATVVIAGREYGTGSSRDWAAKGTLLLGVQAVIAESFERIHRSNLVGMGVLPLQFIEGETRKTLKLSGDELFDIAGLDADLQPGQNLPARIQYPSGEHKYIQLQLRLDTAMEIDYYRAGGLFNYVLKRIVDND